MDAIHEQKDAGGTVLQGDNLAFLAFALSHAACGNGPVEVRIDGRCLIEWCPDCEKLEVFVSSTA